MSLLPDLPGNVRRSRELARADKYVRDTELEAFRHHMQARLRAEMDRADSAATTEAVKQALNDELDLWDYGLERAGGCPARTALVARYVDLLHQLSHDRLSRRFDL